MFLQNLRAKIGARLSGQGESGFTLIELLVVMLILGILAAIALPAFFNQKSKAGDAKAKETAHSAQVAEETCSTESSSGEYTGCDKTKLEAIEPTLKGQEFTVTPGTPNGGYTITVTGSPGHTFSIVRSGTGELTYPCTPKEKGGCPSSESWGNG